MSSYDRMLKACDKFHDKHPEVWDLFVQFTFERINRGFTHYSARGVWHRIRWETSAPHARDPKAKFKLSNNHTPFYARAFMKIYPQYKGFFLVKEQISKRN